MAGRAVCLSGQACCSFTQMKTLCKGPCKSGVRMRLCCAGIMFDSMQYALVTLNLPVGESGCLPGAAAGRYSCLANTLPWCLRQTCSLPGNGGTCPDETAGLHHKLTLATWRLR